MYGVPHNTSSRLIDERILHESRLLWVSTNSSRWM
jgi:hypothetical protein